MDDERGMTCIDCGGDLKPLSYPPEDGWEPGDVVAYRCRDCADMWYLEVDEDDLDDAVSDGRGDQPSGL